MLGLRDKISEETRTSENNLNFAIGTACKLRDANSIRFHSFDAIRAKMALFEVRSIGFIG